MPCTCRECLELAARGADVELLKCALQDPVPFPGLASSSPTQGLDIPEFPPHTRTSRDECGIQRLQIVPFGLDEVSASELEDPDQRAYIWELDDGRHTLRHHEHRG